MPKATEYELDLASRTRRLSFVLSQAGFAKIVDVSPSSVSRWCKGEDRPTGTNAATVMDLEYVVSRYALDFPVDTFRDWFTTPNAFLNGATPKDALALEGPSRVVAALSSETAGSYA